MNPDLPAVAIILAAGHGRRMLSAKPKVMHCIAGLPLLGHVLASVDKAGFDQRIVVHGPELSHDVGFQAFLDCAAPSGGTVARVEQTKRLGTGHAVRLACQGRDLSDRHAVVLFGDTPFISPGTLKRLCGDLSDRHDVMVLAFEPADAGSYGRLVMENGQIQAIVEAGNASNDQLSIPICNGGVMAFRGAALQSILPQLSQNAKTGEIYLTDAVEIASQRGLSVGMRMVPEGEILGINSRAHLADAERLFQQRARARALENGISMVDPESVYFSFDTKLEPDVLLEPSIWFGPGVSVGRGSTIKAFSHLEQTLIGENATIGPFARLRPTTKIGNGVKVGNFVEIKAATIDKGAKVNHLSYVGDAYVGARANVGAGAITCNYDGVTKHHTHIGQGAFVGSNTSLIAPISIGKGSYIGSGTAISDDLAPGDLAVARPVLRTKPGWTPGKKKQDN